MWEENANAPAEMEAASQVDEPICKEEEMEGREVGV